MDTPPLFAVIMAGGSGTRFWPASRRARPKQFLAVSGGRAMLVETVSRLEGLVDRERVLVVTAADQANLVRETLPELPAENVLAEPEARNTAPCLAFAAVEVERRDPDAVQVVLAADHVIEPASSFRATLAAGARAAAANPVLVTFGVVPTHPATGYGYVRTRGDGESVGEHQIFDVERFVEKPDREHAEAFLAEGGFYWNAGIFAWRTRTLLEAFERHEPALADGARRLSSGETLDTVYPRLPAAPIDTAILERADNVRLVPIDYRWNDVGSWSALTELSAPDEDGNWQALSGGARLVAEDSTGCVAYAEGEQLVALIGVQDLIVVHADGATLVCPRDRAQDVKRIVERLRTEDRRFL